MYSNQQTSPRLQPGVSNECERTAEPSMAQVLHISNGDTLNQKLSMGDNRIGTLIKEKVQHEKIIEELYLGALSRFPTDAEKSKLIKMLAESTEKDARQVLEDLFWAVLSSKEFLFNH